MATLRGPVLLLLLLVPPGCALPTSPITPGGESRGAAELLPVPPAPPALPACHSSVHPLARLPGACLLGSSWPSPALPARCCAADAALNTAAPWGISDGGTWSTRVGSPASMPTACAHTVTCNGRPRCQGRKSTPTPTPEPTPQPPLLASDLSPTPHSARPLPPHLRVAHPQHELDLLQSKQEVGLGGHKQEGV